MAKELNKDQRRLVSENLNLAEQLAWRFGSSVLSDRHEKCITMDELKQEAVMGLCEAASRYDPDKGVEFRTVAYIWCRKYVLRAVRKFGTPLTVPDNFEGGVELLHLDAMMEDVASAYALNDDNGSPADRIFYCLAARDEEERDSRERRRKRLALAMNALNEKERKVLTCLFGLDGKEMTVAETARILGVGSCRVCQIRERAMRKLEQSKNFILCK